MLPPVLSNNLIASSLPTPNPIKACIDSSECFVIEGGSYERARFACGREGSEEEGFELSVLPEPGKGVAEEEEEEAVGFEPDAEAEVEEGVMPGISFVLMMFPFLRGKRKLVEGQVRSKKQNTHSSTSIGANCPLGSSCSARKGTFFP